jgi:hypothetical protein
MWQKEENREGDIVRLGDRGLVKEWRSEDKKGK